MFIISRFNDSLSDGSSLAVDREGRKPYCLSLSTSFLLRSTRNLLISTASEYLLMILSRLIKRYYEGRRALTHILVNRAYNSMCLVNIYPSDIGHIARDSSG